MIKGLHHNAYRCRDSEETRRFYEDFLGLPLAHTLEIKETKSGRPTHTLHTVYALDDGSYLACSSLGSRRTTPAASASLLVSSAFVRSSAARAVVMSLQSIS